MTDEQGSIAGAETPAPAAKRLVPPLLAGATLIVAAVFLLAGMDGLGKHLTGEFHVVQVVWARFFFHIALVAGFLWLSRSRTTSFVSTRRPAFQALRGLLLLMGTAAMYVGLTRVPLGDATAILFFNPVVVIILSILILKERIRAFHVVAVVAGFSGVMIIIRPGFAQFDTFLLLPLFSSFVLAGFYLMTRALSEAGEARAALLVAPAVGAVVVSCAVPFFWQWPSLEGWLALAAVGGLGALGHGLLQLGFRFATASALSPFLYCQVIAAALIGVFAFDELPDWGTLTGMLLIVASGMVILLHSARRPRPV